MPRPQEVVTVNVHVMHVGDRAVKVEQGLLRDVWLPLSQIHDPEVDDLVVGMNCDLTIPRWLADEKGLEC